MSFDQWRGDWINNSQLHLPTLKRLARRSVVAERCLTASPQCVPARASWLTGLWPSDLGITRNGDFTLPSTSPSFVRLLHQKGWRTSLIGKTHWHPHSSGIDLRDRVELLQQLGFDEVNEIAGPRALAEVRCALTDDWETYQPRLQERYREDRCEDCREERCDPGRERRDERCNAGHIDDYLTKHRCGSYIRANT